MKTVIITLLFISNMFSQGNFAGDFKSLIGLKYSNEVPPVNGFVYMQGVVISDSGAPFPVTINMYQKNKISIVTLEKLVDSKNKTNAILEVLKITDVPKNYEIRISSCTSSVINPDDKIVAVLNPGTKRKIKLIKEAFVLKDIRFEKLSTKKMNCINEN